MLTDLARSATLLTSWPATAAATVLSVALGTLVVQGILTYYKEAGSKRGLAVASVASGVLLLFSVSAYYCAEFANGFVNLSRSSDAQVITKEWNQAASPRQRLQDSHLLARTMFVETGRIVNFLSESGELVLFVPIEQDYKARDSWLLNWVEIRVAITLLRTVSVVWLLLPIGALFATTALRRTVAI